MPTAEAPVNPGFLEKFSSSTAIALCDVIVSVLNVGLRGDDVPFLNSNKPPLRIDWAVVADAMRGTTGLQTPLECQRLWKYIAYGIDIGELAVLAPDSDDEDASLHVRK